MTADGKIKVLHVIDSLGVGGMERVVIDVANGLDAERFTQAVCCISRRGEAAKFLRDDVRCIDLGKGAKADRLMPLKLARVIRQQQPDIVHSQSWSGVDTAIAKLLTRDIRLVHSEHGRNFPHLDAEPWGRRIARRGVYQLADAAFAVSSELRDFYCCETGFQSSECASSRTALMCGGLTKPIGGACAKSLDWRLTISSSARWRGWTRQKTR